MRRKLIITHGLLAYGLSESLKLFIGEQHGYDVISAYADDSNVEQVVTAYLEGVGAEELVVFTDVFGGSVQQLVYRLTAQRSNAHILAGVNLPMLMEFSVLDQQEGPLVKEQIHALVEASRKAIVDVAGFLVEHTFDAEDE